MISDLFFKNYISISENSKIKLGELIAEIFALK
jgi:predicted DNA-binding ribbon-helix-helix protein